MSPKIELGIEEEPFIDYDNQDSDDFEHPKFCWMSNQDTLKTILSANISPSRGSTPDIFAEDTAFTRIDPDDLPRVCAQWLIKGPVRAYRRPDLEEKLESTQAIFMITQENQTAFIVIDDRSLPPDETKFQVHDPNTDPDNIPIFTATPAEAVKLLERAAAFDETDGTLSRSLNNKRKQHGGASRKGNLIAKIK